MKSLPVNLEKLTVSQCRPALGTFVRIALRAEACRGYNRADLLHASVEAFRAIEQIEALMSFHRADSELSKINLDAHRNAVEISNRSFEVLSFALELSRATEGLFDLSIAPELVRRGALPQADPNTDPRGNWRDIELDAQSIRFHRPTWLDLGGIAKGYAVDQALSQLPPDIHAVVNAGGDLRMSHWQGEMVEIRLATDEDQAPIQAELPMVDAALATSAPYPEGHYPVVDPQKPSRQLGFQTVSVFAPSCMVADAMTKVVFLNPGCDELLASHGATAAVFDRSGNLTVLGADDAYE